MLIIALIGYVRVSTEEEAKEGISLDAQKARITEWCEQHRHQLVVVYEDCGRFRLQHGTGARYPGGPCPCLVRNEIEYAVIELTQTLRTERRSLRQIAAELTRRGMATKTGRPWSAQAVSNILARQVAQVPARSA